MKRSYFTKFLSVFLAVLTLLMTVPLEIFADGLRSQTGETQTNEEDYDESYTRVGEGVFEVTELREESVKHFRNADGSYTAFQYDMPVHILDEDGTWQDIDNTLSESGQEFTTPNARIKFAKKVTGNEALFTLHEKNRKLTLSLDGAVKKTAGRAVNTVTEFDESATVLQKLTTLDKLTSRVIYEEILPGVDLEYVAEGLNIKENLIVKERLSSYSWSFTMKLNNLTAELLADGSVRISDEKRGEAVYRIPAPVVFDAAGSYAPEGAAYYTLSELGSNRYRFTVTADGDWMNHASRTYPVTIDPPFYTASSVTDTYVDSNATMTPLSQRSTLLVSSTQHAYWRISSLAVLPADAFITRAQLSMAFDPTSFVSGYLGAYPVESNWNVSLTWNGYASTTSPQGKIGSRCYDFVNISNSDEIPVFTLDLTALVKGWHEGTIPNYGVCLRPLSGSTLSGTAKIYSNEGDKAVRPQLTLQYRRTGGVENYWSTSSQSADSAGTGSVNLFRGYLTFAFSGWTTTDGILPYTPELIYNSTLAGKYFKYGPSLTSFTKESVGYGWKSGSDQSVKKFTYAAAEGLNYDCYIWVDADGSEHAFLPYQNLSGSTIYYDEDGLGLRLVALDNASSTGLCYSITSQYGENFYFDENGWLVQYVDTFDNRRFYERDYEGRLLSVSLKPADRTSEIEQVLFGYNAGGLLSTITYQGSGKQLRFTYSASGSGTISASNTGYLRKIGFYSSSSSQTALGTVEYEYTSSGLLSRAVDTFTGYSLVYSWSSNRVSSVSEYHNKNGNNTLGQTLSFTYNAQGKDETVCQDSGADDTQTTSDDLRTHYVFDSYGRTISSYVTNVAGDRIYGTTNTSYTETSEESVQTNNRITGETSAGASRVNYLVNGTFDTSLTGWSYVSCTNSFAKDNGNGVAKLTRATVTGGTSLKGMYQTVTLQPGRYTFSADLKLSGLNGTSKTSLKVTNSSGSSVLFETETMQNNNAVAYSAGYIPMTLSVNVTTAGTYRFYIEFDTTSTVNALYADNVSLVKAEGPGVVSLIRDGGFEVHSGNSYTHWTRVSAGSAAAEAFEDSNSMVLVGSRTSAQYARQIIPLLDSEARNEIVAAGKANSAAPETWVLAGYVKGESCALRDDRVFGLKAQIRYLKPDGTYLLDDPVILSADPNATEWQYVSGTITSDPSKGYVYEIYVYCAFEYNVGTACFDDIVLVGASDTVNYEYNSDGNVTKIINGEGTSTEYVYSGVDVIREKYSNGITRYRAYDRHQVISDIYQGANYESGLPNTSYSYNSCGLLTQSMVTASDSSAHVMTSYTYSTDTATYGQLKSVTTPTGVTTYHYSTSASDYGLLKAVIGENGKGSAYTYDAMGRITRTQLAEENGTGYTVVDDMGESAYGYTGDELTSVTTPSMVYTFGYNPFGSRESVSAGGNKIARYLYNAKNGKLRYVVYGNGYVERYDYDELNRIESVLYHENGDVEDTETEIKGYAYTPLIEYRYDGEGNLSQYYDGIEEAWYLYRYDIHGRIESVCRYAAEGETLSVIEKTAYTYDGNSRLSGIQGVYTVNGKAYPYAETYGYDGMGRLTGYTGNGVTTAYSYTTMGDVSTVKTTYGGFSATTVYTYESVAGTELSGRIEEVETFVEYGAAVRSGSNYSYEYDEGGNITEIAKGNEVQYRYSYDDLGQLIREENVPEQKVYVYEYDDAGNILRKKTYSYYGDPSGEADSVYQYGYGSTGWKDRLLSYRGESITYDDLGNPLSYYNGSSYSFTWEKGRQLSQAVKGSSTTEFIYDAEGRRIGKIGAGGMTTTYVWEGELLIAEYREGYDETIYLYDANGSPIGFRYKDDAGYYTQGVYLTFFYEKNLQGDIIGILDENGYKFVEYSYDAWGNLLSMEYVGSGLWSLHYNMAESNPFRYRGYYYDRETGFYYLESRYYDPVIGRFINADGQLTIIGDMTGGNLYAYCGNNPVNRIDPTGEAWWHWALGAGVVAICAIATVITAGGFAAAAGAVIAVGNGIAAATTASTVAAGAFIGSATVLGMAAISAAASSGSMQEFYDQGNWGTVAMTAASAVLGGVNGYKLWKTTQSMVNSIPDNSACFVAGTMIETENGSVPIEAVTAGMLVYAHDPETGKTELKEVVQTFVRETDELVHIEVNGEEILTTPTHPFWVPEKGWTDAIQLRAGDRLQLLNGEYVIVEQVQHEILEAPVTVYNFEVKDFHTYYVSDSAILVHNACKPTSPNQMQKQVKSGQAPKGVDSVHGAHQLPHGKPHVHFSDGTSLNMDGSVHDKKGGIPVLTNAIKIWLEKNGWNSN